MKSVIFACLVTVISLSANAKGGGHGGYHGGHHVQHQSSGHYTGTGSNPNSHNVSGYTKRDGTHVAPHHSTNPNHTQRDNYGTVNNYNPHNGQYGTRYADK